MADRDEFKPVMIVEGIQMSTKLLGSGSFSEVYEGSWNDAPCALKVLNSKDEISEQDKDLLFNEAKKWFKLRHPNVVQFYGLHIHPDAGNMEKPTSFVLEYLPYDLHKFVTKFIKAPNDYLFGFKCNILIDVALALRYMHSIKMAHRDLTPNNVLLTPSFRAKVTDFGTAKIYDCLENIGVKWPTQCGTKDFMPPEVLDKDRGYKPDGFTTDQFSFGCLMLFVFVHEWPEPVRKDVLKDSKVVLTLNEFQRREQYIGRLGTKEKKYCESPLRVCLAENPQDRKNVTWIYKQLTGPSMKCYEKYQKVNYYSKILEAYVLESDENEQQTEKADSNVTSPGNCYIITLLFTVILSFALGMCLKYQVFSNFSNSTFVF